MKGVLRLRFNALEGGRAGEVGGGEGRGGVAVSTGAPQTTPTIHSQTSNKKNLNV